MVAGGGAASCVQASTLTLRAASLCSTGGVGNPLISVAELGGSVVASVIAIVLPILSAIVFCLGVAIILICTPDLWRRKTTAESAAPPYT